MRPFYRVLKHPATSLLLFQVTSFLTPWLIVVWLSFQSNLDELANFSLLLAIFAPLTLFFTAPSRNYMLSNNDHIPGKEVYIRLLLLAVGFVIALAIGYITELLLLSLAVYLYKSTEFLFDFSIVKGIKNEDTRYLWKVLQFKTLVIAAGMFVIFFIQDIKLLLFILAIGFTVIGIDAKKIQQVDLKRLYPILVAVLPLSVTSVVFSVYFNIPRYVLGGAEQAHQLSIYTVTSFIWIGLLVVVNAVCQSKLYVWSNMYKTNRIKALYASLIKMLVLLLLICLLTQIFHLPAIFDFFWLLHNNLHQDVSSYVALSHLQVSLILGPVLFSASNYLLMILNKHASLLTFSFVNAIGTALMCVATYDPQFPGGLIWIMALSGVVQFVICSLIFIRETALKGK